VTDTDVKAVEAEVTIEVGDPRDPFVLKAEVALDDGVLVLFGPSGSGKSLTLRALVGVVRPAAGRIVVRGETLFDAGNGLWVPPHRRRIGYVPQHHSLFPFCDVYDNVAFGLPKGERRRDNALVDQLIRELGVEHLRDSRPDRLSGGERQRVALARALAVKPRLLVLDEPFASIDMDGRSALRETLRHALARHATPAVFVTHDPAEAEEIGDWMVAFERGRTVASGKPADVLSRG
jgi:molybdate transport system ATP-binding protein